MPPAFYPDRLFLLEGLMRGLFLVFDWLHPGRLPVVGFDFAFPSPNHASEFGRAFPGLIRFSQPITSMWVKTADLRTPMYRDDAAVRRFLGGFYRYIVIPKSSDHLAKEQVRDYLLQVSPLWPELRQTAKALKKSVSTLQRQLANEGTSFQNAKDTLRRDLAIVRLASPAEPLSKIASELGFSDSAVFQRAFKLWTGSTPGTYRMRRPQSDRDPSLRVLQDATEKRRTAKGAGSARR